MRAHGGTSFFIVRPAVCASAARTGGDKTPAGGKCAHSDSSDERERRSGPGLAGPPSVKTLRAEGKERSWMLV
jgi:hypothetical protein